MRSKNLVTWEEATANPLLGWPDWSDRRIAPSSLLDKHGIVAQKRTCTSLNYSDIDVQI